ncbi:hypothetical protein [Breoghania sp.]|uniref:hypothetical protein n=1 Tax=Breoghania sp. TaxID=2065378 RepID=UPI00260C62C6|nr:hypothetical protein [Breoghania sp.]MDJ0932935.1 hypothetical protein [Breoghania sp.]
MRHVIEAIVKDGKAAGARNVGQAAFDLVETVVESVKRIGIVNPAAHVIEPFDDVGVTGFQRLHSAVNIVAHHRFAQIGDLGAHLFGQVRIVRLALHALHGGDQVRDLAEIPVAGAVAFDGTAERCDLLAQIGEGLIVRLAQRVDALGQIAEVMFDFGVGRDAPFRKDGGLLSILLRAWRRGVGRTLGPDNRLLARLCAELVRRPPPVAAPGFAATILPGDIFATAVFLKAGSTLANLTATSKPGLVPVTGLFAALDGADRFLDDGLARDLTCVLVGALTGSLAGSSLAIAGRQGAHALSELAERGQNTLDPMGALFRQHVDMTFRRRCGAGGFDNPVAGRTFISTPFGAACGPHGRGTAVIALAGVVADIFGKQPIERAGDILNIIIVGNARDRASTQTLTALAQGRAFAFAALRRGGRGCTHVGLFGADPIADQRIEPFIDCHAGTLGGFYRPIPSIVAQVTNAPRHEQSPLSVILPRAHTQPFFWQPSGSLLARQPTDGRHIRRT